MVVVALLSVIVLGLMAMFTQTQRAFRTGMSQTDILESGRMGTDIIAREFEEITPCYYSNYNATFYPDRPGRYSVPNFVIQVANDFTQALPGGSASRTRTNVMADVFFLVRQNQTWTGIGYFVRTNLALGTDIGPVGTLYRFETNDTVVQFQQNPGGLWAGFGRARSSTNFNAGVSKILDGVVNFRIQPFDTTGWPLTNNPAWWTNAVWLANANSSLPPMLLSTNLMPAANTFPGSGEIVDYFFYSNAVPASVEFELGILEPQILDRYKSIPVADVQASFLANQAAHVHVFRHRVRVRSVDPSAYSAY